MALKIFALKDETSGAFLRPMFADHLGDVLRGLAMQAQDPKSFIARFPQDYSLWNLGEFEQESGRWITPAPVHVINIPQLLATKQPAGLERSSENGGA